MQRLTRILLPIIWVLILLLPPYVYLANRSFAPTLEPGTIFPLFGLMAFTFIWSQIMLGAFMRPLARWYKTVFPFHIFQGISALLFAFLHPLFLFISLPAAERFKLPITFVAPGLDKFVFLGDTGLFLLFVGVAAGALRKTAWLKKYWHRIHFVNYLVFFLIFFHSWNLGTDVQSSPILRPLWLFFFGTVVLGIIYRRWYIPKQESSSLSARKAKG